MFLFTGVMAYGPRKSFEVLVLERGGEIAMGVSKKVHYLMVGEIGNDQWLHSTYGKKKSKKLWSYERIVRRSRLSASSTGKRRCSARPPGREADVGERRYRFPRGRLAGELAAVGIDLVGHLVRPHSLVAKHHRGPFASIVARMTEYLRAVCIPIA